MYCNPFLERHPLDWNTMDSTPSELEVTDSSPQLGRLQTLERLLAIQATTLEAALTEAANSLVPIFRADKIDVFLYDETKETLIAAGTSQTPMGIRQRQLGLHWLPLANGGRAAWVFQSGQPHHDGHVEEDQEELRGIREALGVRSQIIMPLEVGDRCRGVLSVCSAQRDHFSIDDLHFLQTVSYWVSMVMQRAELVERLTREATEQTRQLVADELITIMAHDFGNYLTPLIGRLYLLRTRAEREGRARDVEEADALGQGLQRLQRLIADLLDVGRIDQGVFAVMRQPVNLVQLARETAAALQTAQFKVDVQSPDELIAEVDADRIQQVIENLLVNAQRHAPGSPVTLTVQSEARADGPRAIVSVQDRGPGIPPEMQRHLMQRFTRGQRSKGLGIGLYLARRIMEAHGGALTVESGVGIGTTFHLAVPQVAPPEL